MIITKYIFKIKFTNIDHFKEGIKNQIFANIDYYYLYTLYELEIKLRILFPNNYILYTYTGHKEDN